MTRHQTSDAIPAIIRSLAGVAIAAVAAVGAFAVVTAPIARAAVQTVSSNRAAARIAAKHRLAHAALPPGATPVATDPEPDGPIQWLQNDGSPAPSGSNVADAHRFFRLPGRPLAVFRWLNRHRPRGSTLLERGHSAVNGRTVEWSVSWAFRGVRNTIAQEGIGFVLTTARGGGTALRVDAWAVWVVPRPAFERVPDDVFAVAVSLDRPGAKPVPVSMVTDPRSVRTLADFVNSLRAVQPQDTVGCSPDVSPRIDLRFLFAVGAPPVARAVGDGCFALNFSVLGRRGPKLSTGNTDPGDLLWKLHAVPVCTPAQLSGSATLPERSPFQRAYSTTQLRLTNVSQAVCGLKGFPRIQLRDANGQPLPTRATNLDAFTPAAILAPNTFAETELEWGATAQCHGPAAAKIDITPPGLRSTLTIPVGSPAHPVQPCDGAMYVTPVEEAVTS